MADTALDHTEAAVAGAMDRVIQGLGAADPRLTPADAVLSALGAVVALAAAEALNRLPGLADRPPRPGRLDEVNRLANVSRVLADQAGGLWLGAPEAARNFAVHNLKRHVERGALGLSQDFR